MDFSSLFGPSINTGPAVNNAGFGNGTPGTGRQLTVGGLGGAIGTVGSIGGAIGNVSDSLFGTGASRNTSGTRTTQTEIDPEGLNYLFKSLLESNSGLAPILSAEQEAGLYNSPTAQLLVNDVLARSAGEVAARTGRTTEINRVGENSATQGLVGKGGSTLANLGKAGGSIYGGVLGSAFGPAGTAIGSTLGGVVGGVVGKTANKVKKKLKKIF